VGHLAGRGRRRPGLLPLPGRRPPRGVDQ